MDEKKQSKMVFDAIKEYREYLEKRVAECRKQLEKERASAVRAIENDNFPEHHRKNLIELRVEADAYANALNALDVRIDEAIVGKENE